MFWPTWEWATDPSVRWFFASYDQKLSTRDSVRCRSLFQGTWYNHLFPGKVVLTGDQNQKTYYETAAGGYRMATSVGGHGTGEHPDRICIDDPHNVKEAESEQERSNTTEWWDLTMSTRGMSRDARRVIIMQRLHEEDLSGHVLKEKGWVHLCLPMRYEPNRMVMTPLGWNDPRQNEGDLLTKDQFNEERLEAMEKPLGAYGTAGQMQQRPVPKGGGLFKNWYFNSRRPAAPYHAKRVRYWDTAGTHMAGDATVGTLMAKDDDGDYYVEHVEWGQWEPGERDNMILAVAKRDQSRYGPRNAPVIWIEKGMADSGISAFKHMVKKLAGFRVLGHKPTGDKEIRANPFASQCAALNVHLVEDGSWDINEWIKELCAFPMGKLVDRVDSASGAFSRLEAGRVATGIHVYHAQPRGKKAQIRIAVCSKEELAHLRVDDPCLLISVSHDGTTPGHTLPRLLDFVTLPIHDVDAAEHQDTWGQPVIGYDKPAVDLVMQKDLGQRLWAFLLKQRQTNPTAIIVQDNGGEDRRAKSIAYAIADMLWDGRRSVWSPSQPEEVSDKEKAPNGHIYATVKASRGMVAI